MIRRAEVDAVLVQALPELAADRAEYERQQGGNAGHIQSFFSYSFVPTLQSALDREVRPFCERAFAVIERLLVEGDGDVQEMLREEFFEYGPVCEKWMRRALPFMGSRTRALAEAQDAERSR